MQTLAGPAAATGRSAGICASLRPVPVAWRLLIVAVACLALVVLGWRHLAHTGGPSGDRVPGPGFPGGRLHRPVTQLGAFFGDLATPGVALTTIAVAAAVVAWDVGVAAGALVLAAGGSPLLSKLLKRLLGPTGEARGVGGDHYPSGHVAYATSLFGCLAVLAARHDRPEVAVVCVGLVVAMGPMRVVARAHVPSDALAGYATGAAWLCALLALATALT